MHNFKEETVSSETIYNGKILNIRKDKVLLPDNRNAMREIVEHSGGVAVIPIISNHEILIVRQYRIAVDEILWELPAGKLEPGEDPRVCAGRELEEETGYRAGKIKKLFSFYTSPGYSDEILHLYIARDLSFTGQKMDQDEFIEVEKVKKENMMQMIYKGQIKDSKSIIGLLYFLWGDIK